MKRNIAIETKLHAALKKEALKKGVKLCWYVNSILKGRKK